MEQSHRILLFVAALERAYVRRMQIPRAVLPHLSSAIELQLPKLLPLDPKELLTDFEIMVGGSSNQTVSIDIAALKKADLTPVLDRLRAWGLHIVSTHLGETPAASRRFRFAAYLAYSGRKLNLQRLDRILIGVAAALGLACVSVAATEIVSQPRVIAACEKRDAGSGRGRVDASSGATRSLGALACACADRGGAVRDWLAVRSDHAGAAKYVAHDARASTQSCANRRSLPEFRRCRETHLKFASAQ